MTAPKKPPRLMMGGLTKAVYVVTRYRDHGNGLIEATGDKHDVTGQFLVVAAHIDKTAADLLADALGYEITQRAEGGDERRD